MQRLWTFVVAALMDMATVPAWAAFIGAEPSIGKGVNIVILDKIVRGDAERFRQVVLTQIQQDKWVNEVRVFSPGGSTTDGIEIGKQIRLLRATTVAPTLLDKPQNTRMCLTSFAQNGAMMFDFRYRTGNPRCDCASSCFIIWAAGASRKGDVLGVHRMKWEDFNFTSTTQANNMYDDAIGRVSAYLRTMDVPDYVIRMMMATSSSTMHYLSKSELAPMLGLRPGIDEMVFARCGGRPNGDNYQTMAQLNCAFAIYEEESRVGAVNFMKVYQSHPLTDIYH
jgi:hypothetical protein